MAKAILARRILRDLGNADSSLDLPARSGTQLVNFFARFEAANRGIKTTETERASGMNAYAREYRHAQGDKAMARFVRLSATEFTCILCDSAKIDVGYEAVNAYADRVAAHVATPMHGVRATLRAIEERRKRAGEKGVVPGHTGSSPA